MAYKYVIIKIYEIKYINKTETKQIPIYTICLNDCCIDLPPGPRTVAVAGRRSLVEAFLYVYVMP